MRNESEEKRNEKHKQNDDDEIRFMRFFAVTAQESATNSSKQT